MSHGPGGVKSTSAWSWCSQSSGSTPAHQHDQPTANNALAKTSENIDIEEVIKLFSAACKSRYKHNFLGTFSNST
jgi:hypothetical protein